MNQELNNRITNYLGEESYIDNRATDDEIKIAEEDLSVTFDSDYKEFIKLFGGCYVGISIYAFKSSDDLEGDTILDLTKQYKQQSLPGANLYYVISFDGSDNPIAINESGEVVIYNHDSAQMETLYNSFEEMIKEVLPD